MIRAALFLCAALAFPGCASVDLPKDDYTWYRSGYVTTHYEWHHVSKIENYCGSPAVIGCAIRHMFHWTGRPTCIVYSTVSEQQAREWIPLGQGISHFVHEVGEGSEHGRVNPDAKFGHCAGNDHAEATMSNFFSYGGRRR